MIVPAPADSFWSAGAFVCRSWGQEVAATTRLVQQMIPSPALGAQRRPLSFWWRGEVHRVAAVLDTWRDVGEWWEGEQEKTFWRVQIAAGGVVDLWRDAAGSGPYIGCGTEIGTYLSSVKASAS